MISFVIVIPDSHIHEFLEWTDKNLSYSLRKLVAPAQLASKYCFTGSISPKEHALLLLTWGEYLIA